MINGKKSEFFMEEIHFLGHLVSKEGVRMDPTKVEAIKSWPDLRTLHDVRSFLGLCSYYRSLFGTFQRLLHHCMIVLEKESSLDGKPRKNKLFII